MNPTAMMSMVKSMAQQPAGSASAEPSAVVSLSAEQYYRLMSLCKDVQLAAVAVGQAQARVREAEQKRNAYMADLQKAHPELDFGAGYQNDDETCTLTPVAQPT